MDMKKLRETRDELFSGGNTRIARFWKLAERTMAPREREMPAARKRVTVSLRKLPPTTT